MITFRSANVKNYWLKQCQWSNQLYCNPRRQGHDICHWITATCWNAGLFSLPLLHTPLVIKWQCGIGLILPVHLGTCLSHNRKPICFFYLMLGNPCTSVLRSVSRVSSTSGIFSHSRKICWKEHKSKTCTHRHFQRQFFVLYFLF